MCAENSKPIKPLFLFIVFAFNSIGSNVAYGVNVAIVSSENISAKIASIGGRAESVRISGISRDGSVSVGKFRDTRNAKYFRYFANENKLEILNPILEKNIVSNGTDLGDYLSLLQISANGKVIAGNYFSSKDLSSHVFLYSDLQGYKYIGNFGLVKAGIQVTGVSVDGSKLVGEFRLLTSDANYQAFKYSEEEGFINLKGMGKEQAFAKGVSSDGSIIVGNYRNGVEADHAFKYSPIDGVIDIAAIGRYASAKCVSDDGSVIVGTYLGGFNFSEFNSYQRAFIYTHKDGVKKLGAMSFLGDSAVPLSISAKGDYFNGVYVDFFGHSHIFKASISD